MVLESCMILLDNSEYMRNGDYIPNRLEAQHDAANLLVGTKTQSNPESTVGVIAMTGEVDGAELLISPTDDMGKILSALHGVPIRSGGRGYGIGKNAAAGVTDGTDITGAIQVASLALKHRRNKNGAQRVVVFLGSPLTCDARALLKCGRQLKKNNIAVDVVCLGELEGNEPLVQELVNAANGVGDSGERTCHVVTVPAGVLPSDVLVSSPIVAGAGAGAAAAAAMMGAGGLGDFGSGATFADYGGVDPNMDPELAMALRVSMEEERVRQERLAAERAAAAASEESKSSEGSGPQEESAAAGGPTAMEAETLTASGTMGEDDEDALLQQALAMSMQEHTAADSSGNETTAAAVAASTERMDMDEEEEDAAMQVALQMSLQQSYEGAPVEEGMAPVEERLDALRFQDPSFVNQLLGSLPGVDPNDPAIQQALRNLQQQGEKKDEQKEDETKKDG